MAQKKGELNDKQRRFCREYLVDLNGTQAAIRAGYSPKSAATTASDMLKYPHVEAELALLRSKTADLAGVSALRNMKELAKIAYASTAQLRDTWITLKDYESITDDQKACIESIDTKEETVTSRNGEEIKTSYVKIKMYSKLTAIEMLNKMNGFNAPEKTDITSAGKSLAKRPRIVFERKTPL
jgi:phage terminase small subunit